VNPLQGTPGLLDGLQAANKAFAEQELLLLTQIRQLQAAVADHGRLHAEQASRIVELENDLATRVRPEQAESDRLQAQTANEHIRQMLESARERELQDAEAQRELRKVLSKAIEQAQEAQRDLIRFQTDAESSRRAHELEVRRLFDRIEAVRSELFTQAQSIADVERHHANTQRESEQSAAQQVAAAQEEGRLVLHQAADAHRHELQQMLARVEESKALAHQLKQELAKSRAAADFLRSSPLNRLFGLAFPEKTQSNRGDELPALGNVGSSAHTAMMASADSQPASTADRNTMQNPVLNDLLILNDVEFVRAAYAAILKRAADSTGEQNYLGRLRQGHDRVRMLADMARSEEGRRAGAVLPGLDQAVRWSALGRLPLLGPLLVGLRSLLRRVPSPDPVAAFHNQSFGLQRAALDLVVEIQASIQRLQQQQAGMEQALRRMGEQQSDIAAAVISMQSGSDPSAARFLTSSSDSSTGDQALQQVQLVRRAAAWEG